MDLELYMNEIKHKNNMGWQANIAYVSNIKKDDYSSFFIFFALFYII